MTWPGIEAIRTEHCLLEPLRPEHAEEMVDVLAAPELYEFTGGSAPTLEQLRQRYQNQADGQSPGRRQWWCNWIVRPIETGRPVGYVQATVEDHDGGREAVLAWVINPEDQGRGLATEAAARMVNWLTTQGVTRLVAYIHPQHTASARVASKLGLVPTGSSADGEIRWVS